MPKNGNAWNYPGSVLIAEIAYQHLNADKKKQVDQLSEIMFNDLLLKQRIKLNRQYETVSTFAKLAVMADVFRKWKTLKLFNVFQARVPFNLFFSLNHNTASWHYINYPYPYTHSCRSVKSENIVWALDKLIPDLQHSHHAKTRALLMILIEHYVADIHQPLHTVTNVSRSCKGDSGGNYFCLRLSKKGKCTLNLHALWDSGLGYVRGHQDIKLMALELSHLYPPTFFAKELNINQPALWARENDNEIAFIYRTKPFTLPTPSYYRDGTLLAKAHIALAGYRLAQVLNESI